VRCTRSTTTLAGSLLFGASTESEWVEILGGKMVEHEKSMATIKAVCGERRLFATGDTLEQAWGRITGVIEEYGRER